MSTDQTSPTTIPAVFQFSATKRKAPAAISQPRPYKKPHVGTRNNRLLKPSPQAPPMKANVVVNDENGKPVSIVLVPTSNKFDALQDNSEMIVTETVLPKKIRIPPITVFNTTRDKIDEKLKEITVTEYSIKLLRHGFHVYCSNSEDFKKVRDSLKSAQFNHYSHELADEKHYKVVLTGLHRMTPDELIKELNQLKLAPVAVRIINPRNTSNRADVLYVVSFPRGSVKLSDLKNHNVVCYTRVDWQPYRHRGGLVQCTRCQRPGHGIKHCNMPARCAYCGGDHQSLTCPSTKNAIQNGKKSVNGDVNVETPAKCCNCEADGHFATDMNCPKRIQYVKSRQRNTIVGRRIQTQQPQQTQRQHVPTSSMLSTNGPSYAAVVNSFDFNNSPSGNSGHSGFSRPSGVSNPSGNLIDEPFSMEEISALTFEIISSLRDVQNMPRHEAMKIVMNMAFKYLYRNDK